MVYRSHFGQAIGINKLTDLDYTNDAVVLLEVEVPF